MLRPLLAAIGLMAALVSFPSTSDALLWGLFEDRDRWRNLEPEVQDREAEPLMTRGRQAELQGRNGRAVSLYKRVWKRYPGSRFAAEALYRTGRIELARQEWEDAYGAYSLLLRSYPESPYFNQIVSGLFDVGTAYEEGRDIHWMWIFPYTDERKAVAAYEAVISTAPFSDYAPIALMRIAMIHRREDNVILAIDALDRLINFYPTSILSGDAQLMLAETFAQEVKGPEYDQGATREAISYYRDFLLLFPDNPQVERGEDGLEDMRDVHARSKLILGEFYFNYRDDYAAAEVFFNEAITIAPESPAAQTAREFLVKVAAIKADYPEGNWPRRKDWEYLLFWRKWPPEAEDSDRRSKVDTGEDRPNVPGVENPMTEKADEPPAQPAP